ncbi:MAG: allantoicase [Cytophagales bacterium]|nr:allantoicase [Cytophagales bacterium]
MTRKGESRDFTRLIDLASKKLGGKAIACSDDFFASMDNLIEAGRGIFIEDKYTEFGKWMDGWESRRKRTEGHDWCIVKLGASGTIQGVDVDTNHFLGNHPPHCSIEACISEQENPKDASWIEILPKSPLDPGSQHLFEIDNPQHFTHLKLHIYPDGGVARLKVYGEVEKDWEGVDQSELVDLAAAANGAKSILCNDMFFSHMDNLIMPGKGENMGDGWETKRNRTPNNRDWVIVRLAHIGSIQKIMVDTHHFKGNYPDTCLIEGCISDNDENIEQQNWATILPQSKLQAHHEHLFEDEIENREAITHVRLSIFPDGGISRLRLWGTIDK